MKSKSFDLKDTPIGKGKLSKSFDFVGLYKTAAETNARLLQGKHSSEHLNVENVSTSASESPRENTPSKKKKKKLKHELVDVSVINLDGGSINKVGAPCSTPVAAERVTSTPYSSRVPKVKSIMKNSTAHADDSMDGAAAEPHGTPGANPKKRNKSVSFMLEDNEEVVVKKSKSEESLKSDHKPKAKYNKFAEKNKLKKLKKVAVAEKENTANDCMETDQPKKQNDVPEKKVKRDKVKTVLGEAMADSPASDGPADLQKKKKFKKFKKIKKTDDGSEPTENDSNNNEDGNIEHKVKKLKKKKRQAKVTPPPDTTETEGEPVSKSRKKDVKPDVIADDLENLTIGDNAHTLTNLLDEMTVAEKNKDKKKKNKLRRKKNKTKTASASSSETADLEKIEEGKEKVKWKKRKWNKDKKGDVTDVDNILTTVIVDNLPLNILCTYKTVLAQHFGNFGLIKTIGIAEMYPAEESKPVFTTTVTFHSEAAATKALEDSECEIADSQATVRRPLPATQTTLVVRSYGDLGEQSLSSALSAAGRIRSIRHLVKGRKSMATAFVEFDGPAAVERALAMAADTRVGGKRLHVSRFELRANKTHKRKSTVPDSENEGDSENSNE